LAVHKSLILASTTRDAVVTKEVYSSLARIPLFVRANMVQPSPDHETSSLLELLRSHQNGEKRQPYEFRWPMGAAWPGTAL
jgi:hypothetical protein